MRHVPNILTLTRIAFSPVIAYLLLTASGPSDFLLLYYLFVIAALTDIFDGSLARRHKIVSNFGKLVDPMADKFLLAATLIPFYLLSSSSEIVSFVTLPVVVILLGREVLVTGLRYYAMGQGLVLSASRLAKFKTSFQMFFIGSVLVHFFHHRMILQQPGWGYPWFDRYHYYLNLVVLTLAIVLSLASAAEYLIRNLPTLRHQSRS